MGAAAEGRPHDFISSLVDQLQLIIMNAGLLLPNLLTFQRSKSGILCVCVCVRIFLSLKTGCEPNKAQLEATGLLPQRGLGVGDFNGI